MMGAGTSLPARDRQRTFMPLVAGTFLVAACAFFPFYRYQLTADGISYVSIASQYAAGYWKEAINPYWGPLYSWCLAALLWLRIPALAGIRVLGIVLGLAVLFILRRFASVFAMEERMRRFFLWTAAAVVLGFAMDCTTPDLLFTAILLLYFSLILDPAYPNGRYSGPFCGILGGLAYLTKSYGLVFFFVHFTLMSALYLVRRDSSVRRPAILRQYAAGLAVLCAVSFCWIAALHGKYGVWTTGTTGDFNIRLAGPQSEGYPNLTHFIPPTSPHAITAWQEPSPSWVPHWSIFGSERNVVHESRLIYSNLKMAARLSVFAAPLLVVIVPSYVALCMRCHSKEWIYLLLTIAILCGGYLPLIVVNRYLWAAELLVVWMGFRSLEFLIEGFRIPGVAMVAAALVLVASFLRQPVLTMHADFRADEKLYAESVRLKQSGEIKGRLASCANWHDSAYLALRLGLPYYGVPAPDRDALEAARALNPDYQPPSSQISEQKELLKGLSEERIDWFLVWPDCQPLPPAVGQAQIQVGDLRLVRLTPNSGN